MKIFSILNLVVSSTIVSALLGCTHLEPKTEDLVNKELRARQAATAQALQAATAQAHEETNTYVAKLEQSFRILNPDAAGPATARKEKLVTSFANQKILPTNSLKSVDCRGSRCVVDLRLSGGKELGGANLANEQLAIISWLAEIQDCGFFFTGPDIDALQTSDGQQRIFIDCE